MTRKKHRLRRILTAITLLATTVALFAAVAFFLLRRDHPETAIAFGRIVWVGLIVGIAGGAILTLAGAIQAIVTPEEPEAEETPGSADET